MPATRHLLCLAALAAFGSGASITSAAPYEVIDLTPPDFSSAEIAGVCKQPFMYINPNPADPIRLVGSGTSANTGTAHALLWKNLNNQPVDLNPKGFTWSVILAADANLQMLVGGGATLDGERPVALIWQPNVAANTAGSYKSTDVTPDGFSWAQIYDVADSMRVGWGVPADSNQPHALIWNGDTKNIQDINPGDFVGSGAYAVGSYDIVGMGIPHGAEWDTRHAFFWMGLSHKPVDLNPGGFTMSEADAIYEPGGKISPDVAVAGASVVGTGTPPGIKAYHALLWHGTSPQAVDLNPAGFLSSKAVAITPTQQAGWGNPAGSTNSHALVWNSTAASCVDLHQFLPYGYISSVATCIDPDGDVFGSATDSGGRVHAIEWKLISPDAGETSNAVNTK